LAEEILKSRTDWFFYGICANNTPFPDGTRSRSTGTEMISGGSSSKIQQSYYDSTAHFDPIIPLLYFSYHALDNVCDLPQVKNFPGASSRALPWIVLADVPSVYSNVSELVITGYNKYPDSRGSGRYLLIQRISSSATKELVTEIQQRPQFLEIFYQKSFPGLDSQAAAYTGLYRLKAHTLYLLEPPLLEDFSKKYPSTLDWQGKPIDPYIPGQDNFGLLSRALRYDLNPPLGVGTAVDFAKI
ncbi:hypothetical protein KJ654_02195, partial [Patescibacteria group bacterium]|nr:hypothetical protein [Patescibacteria group bacterium]MBU1967234.1 hypothetical protein [Patescibacteria group bacterium]